MRVRSITAGVVVALAVSLAGCTVPAPSPTPTPTGFADDAAAFAAAEATYRAYVDALNRVDLADPSTFEPAYALTTGEANASTRESFSKMHADGWVVAGTSVLEKLVYVDSTSDQVRAAACLNVSDVRLSDAMGVSQVSPDRPAVQSVLVEAVPTNSTPTGAIIEKLDGNGDESVCAA